MTSSPFVLSCPAPAASSDRIELAHGSGGAMTHRLIEEVFRPAFAHGPGDFIHDGAVLDLGGRALAFSTDTYVVKPLFFPGGDIGSLAVNGTVNDLAMCGAQPLYLSVGLVLEEGFAIADLRRIVASMQIAAEAAGVRLVTGDTKVVERGKGDGLYINTSGIGICLSPQPITPSRIRPGDAIIVSGDIGRHGIAVLAAREDLGFDTGVPSDCAPLAAPVHALITEGVALHCLRDLTRGGLATALIEIAEAGNASIALEEVAIPICDPVRGACEILGLDPLYVANEGRFLAILPCEHADPALTILRRFDPAATVIGSVEAIATPGAVMAKTIGGVRPLDLLAGDQLPRIC